MKELAQSANKDKEQFGTRPAKIRDAKVILCPYCYQPSILSIEGRGKRYDDYWTCGVCNSKILIVK